MICPSVPTQQRRDLFHNSAAVSDYAAPAYAHPGIFQLSGKPVPGDLSGAMSYYGPTRPLQITDGLSNTFLIVECAGRPELWQVGRLISATGGSDGGWAIPSSDIMVAGWLPDGTGGQGSGPCNMNCTNNNEIYSFHPGGVNFAFADGSVRFLVETIANYVISGLTTKAGGEIVAGYEN
jgi:prepilin-type processing-associated H-X9-DG protein